MPVRSYLLKIKTNSGEKQKALELRKALYRTHRLTNEGIAYYMDWLVHLRQESYYDAEKGLVSKEDVQAELLKRVRCLQEEKSWKGEKGSDEEILSILRRLYEIIIPSSTGKNGNANELGSLIYPLVDETSEIGMGTAKSGRKPKWKLMKEQGDPNWEVEYKKDQEKKAKDPTRSILLDLSKYGLRPLFSLFTDTQRDISWLPLGKAQKVRKWDKDMFIQAIERLLSWETWNQKVKEEKEKLEEKVKNYIDKYFTDQDEEWISKIREFEKQRNEQLREVSFASKEGYLITSRQIRKWNELYEKWMKKGERVTKEDLWEVVAELQSKNNREFGDPAVFRFLAEPENHHIWRNYPERLIHFAAYNGLLKKLRNAKEYATFTLPNSTKHPLWTRYEAKGGTNLHLYHLEDCKTHYNVTLSRLIWPTKNGLWKEEQNVTITLARSKQFDEQIMLSTPDKKHPIFFFDYSIREKIVEGTLGGARIQFDRTYLEKHQSGWQMGEIGPVYFNITINIDTLQETKNGRLQTPLGKALITSNFRSEFPKVKGFKPEELQTFVANQRVIETKGLNSLNEGMRVMAVDLGQRTAAAVSIFEVTKDEPNNGLYFPIKDTTLYAVHIRSFLLRLPGEDVDSKLKEKRIKRFDQLYSIRKHIRLLARILKLSNKSSSESRVKILQKMVEEVGEETRWTVSEKEQWITILKRLIKVVHLSDEQWNESLIDAHRHMEEVVGKRVSQWRKSFSNERKGLAGLSMWSIEELEEAKQLLKSWSFRSRTSGSISHQEKGSKFATNLLNHIQNVKDDRLKQLANLIVMTALGYKYDDRRKTWFSKYPACQVILFEDLSRYLFHLDRSRRENNRLMKWAHRSIPKMVYLQAEVYGIQIGDIRSDYSSRFHAASGAPGIRCTVITKLKREIKQKELVDRQFLTEKEAELLKVGDIIPDDSGELFVTLNKDKELIFVHADLNAAQNLQKRFWNQDSEITRISCELAQTKNGFVYVPKSKSERIKKNLGNGAFVKINGLEDVYKWDSTVKIKLKDLSSLELSELSEEGLEDIIQAMEEAEERLEKYKTLFRDPSSIFFPNDRWYPQKVYWGIVRRTIEKRLKERIIK
jgi:hypothetical protein